MKSRLRKVFSPPVRWLIFLILIFQGHTALAAGSQQNCTGNFVWKQETTASFTILYTSSNVSMANEISAGYIQRIEEELPRYEAAFGVELPKRITIRIYPTENEYYCLNSLAPIITEDDAHSHIGSREIALIATVINRSPMTWEEQAVNALRHELAVLFGETLSDGNAPPGLLKGLGGYFEDPPETFPQRYASAGSPTQPDRGLQRLWEEDTSAANSLALVQQTSTVAYIIELLGWEKLVDFLAATGDLQGYRQAAEEVLGVGIQDLETLWIQYFPVYVQTRWAYNVVHGYDLSSFKQLIGAGAYADAAQMLERISPMIALFGEGDQSQRAAALLTQAENGVRAGNLTLEARQAILSGDYWNAYSYASEAQTLFQSLSDSRRDEELEIYLTLSSEILTLREELALLRGDGTPLDPIRSQRIAEIGRRLSLLGDKEGTRQAQLALLLLGTDQRNFVEWVTVIGLLVCIFLIWLRFRDLRKRQQGQVRLL